MRNEFRWWPARRSSRPWPPVFAAAMTVKGEVVDVACATAKKEAGKGAAHASCAMACAKKGQPVGILTADAIYTVTGDYAANNNAKLLDFVAKNVNVTGEVTEKDGQKMITIKIDQGRPTRAFAVKDQQNAPARDALAGAFFLYVVSNDSRHPTSADVAAHSLKEVTHAPRSLRLCHRSVRPPPRPQVVHRAAVVRCARDRAR